MDPPYPSLTAIAAVGANGVIGDGTRVPWHMPGDLARFKRVTMGGVVIMGRRTYESVRVPLYGRVSLVLTRQRDWAPPAVEGAQVVRVSGMAELGRILSGLSGLRWWCAGGGEVFRMLWGQTTHLDITEAPVAPDGRVRFPVINPGQWRQTGREANPGFDVVTYERRGDQGTRALRAWIDAR